MKELFAFSPCGCCVVFMGLWASVSTWLRIGTEDVAVVGVVWPLPSILMNSSGFSRHTPVTKVIKLALLDILHLTDIFDVVKVSDLPLPTHLSCNQGSTLIIDYNLTIVHC